MKKSVIAFIGFFLVFQPLPAIAASVVAAAGETICNQTVGSASGVSAYRLVSGYCVVEFRTVGSTTWTVPNGVTSIEYLVIAGGGGGAGGQASEHGGGGGGAGGFLSGTLGVSSGSISIVVGSGGAGGAANSAGGSGTNSSLGGTITAIGGGRGGTYFSPNAPYAGGSGGGAGVSATTSYLRGESGTAGQGNKGGDVSISGTSARHGAGGGGAGAVGGNTTTSGSVTIAAGAGGDGASSSITGTSITYAGGGGGGGSNAGVGASGGAAGGAGGGGSGATYNGASLVSGATSGTSNTGGGGGGGIGTGGATASSGGSGGSGIIIVRYLLAPSISTIPSISGAASYGETLTATTGTWLYAPTTYTYQWSRAATVGGTYTDIAGAINANYKVAAADVNQFLKITVTATNSGGSGSSTSSATSAITRTAVGAILSIQAGTLIYRQSKTITAITGVAGRITFKANGKNLPGCISKSVSNINFFTANCAYKPSTRGLVTITTIFTPTDSSYIGGIDSLEKMIVVNRGGTR